MCQKVLSKLDHLGPTDGMEGEGGETEKRERKLRERSSTLSLGFLAIGPAVPGEVRRKVLPRAKNFK